MIIITRTAKIANVIFTKTDWKLREPTNPHAGCTEAHAKDINAALTKFVNRGHDRATVIARMNSELRIMHRAVTTVETIPFMARTVAQIFGY